MQPRSIRFTIKQQKIEYSIPPSWSINKTKCLLVSEYTTLNFDYFQLMHSGKLLHGAQLIGNINLSQTRMNVIELIVVDRKSQTSFQQYYQKTMGQYIGSCNRKYQPIFNSDYQKSIINLQQSQQDEDQVQMQIVVDEQSNFSKIQASAFSSHYYSSSEHSPKYYPYQPYSQSTNQSTEQKKEHQKSGTPTPPHNKSRKQNKNKIKPHNKNKAIRKQKIIDCNRVDFIE